MMTKQKKIVEIGEKTCEIELTWGNFRIREFKEDGTLKTERSFPYDVGLAIFELIDESNKLNDWLDE